MSAAVPACAAEGGEPAPAFIRRLLDRGAMLLKTRGVMSVDFRWWDEGRDHRYLARIAWIEDALRVCVFDARSGDLVCRSMAHDCFEVDPAGWDFIHNDDDVARSEWKRDRREGGRK